MRLGDMAAYNGGSTGNWSLKGNSGQTAKYPTHMYTC